MTACYAHHSVPCHKGECHSEKLLTSFHEISLCCSGQLRVLGLMFLIDFCGSITESLIFQNYRGCHEEAEK